MTKSTGERERDETEKTPMAKLISLQILDKSKERANIILLFFLLLS
jgi:hypothetical protein